MLEHMSFFKSSIDWLGDVEYEVLLTIDYKVGTEQIDLDKAFIIDLFGKLMLSSGRDMDRDFVMYKFLHNFYDASVQFSGYYALTPGPYKDYKHEDLIRFARKVKNDKPSMLPLVWEFANVHSRYRAQLEDILVFGEASEISPWKSILHTRQAFELSTSVRRNERIWEDLLISDVRIQRLIQPIMRDIALCENSILRYKGVLIIPTIVLLIHASLRSKIISLASF